MTDASNGPCPSRLGALRSGSGRLAIAVVVLAWMTSTAAQVSAQPRRPAAEPEDEATLIDDVERVDAKAASELEFPNGGTWRALSAELASFGDDEPAINRAPTGSERRYARLATYLVKLGDTLRLVAYKYCTSPAAVAVVNSLPLDPAVDVPLIPGSRIQVPLAFRAPSGLPEAERLLSGPGVHSERDDSNWGRPAMVQLLRHAFRELHKRWPSRHPMVAGSLSKPNGGRLGRHKSHRSGQDIDIGYPTFESNRKHWGMPRLDEIDYQRLWFLVDTLERTGNVAAVYMSLGIQKRLYAYAAGRGESKERLGLLFTFAPGNKGAGLISNAPGHRDHVHIRFICPDDVRGFARDRET